MGNCALILGLLSTAALPVTGAAQLVRGHLVEDGSNLPIANGSLELLDQNDQAVDRTVSDSLGVFLLAADQAGRYRIRAKAPFHVDATTPAVLIETGIHLDVRVVLSPEFALLAPLEVVARSRPLIAGMTLDAFNDRRARGLGFAITRDEFRNQNPRTVSDLIRQLPGVRVSPGHGSSSLKMAGTTRFGPCPVKVVLDGIEFRWGATTIDDIPVHDVYAVEVFRGLADLPIELAAPDARCGVVAIWTMRGVR
ncbi:MAG: TonB-dependent receptor plug domain-containing protein [Longimicrobiales bacterium]